MIVLYYILFRERIKAVERHPEIGKSSAKCFNGNTLILPKRLTILDLNYGWLKFKFWLKIIGWTLNKLMDIWSSALFFDHVVLVCNWFFSRSSTFSVFYLGFYMPFLFWLLYPFSIGTFISLFYLDFNFPFLFDFFSPFIFFLVVFYFEFYFSIWTLEAVLSWIKRTKNVKSILAEFEFEPTLN